MTQYDAIVIGAGHNGLVCASLLAKAGRRVLVVEASPSVGGLASSREFSDGFRAAPVHSVTHFSSVVAGALNLQQYGLSFNPSCPTIGLAEDAAPISLHGDQVWGVGGSDTDAYAEYRQKLLRYGKAISVIWEKTLPRIGLAGLRDSGVYAQAFMKMRGLGGEDMSELVRVLTLPMRDLVSECFEDPRLQALLCWDGLIGSKMAPRSPNNAVLPLLLRMNGESGGDYVTPKGGVSALVDALAACAKAAGVTIKTDAPVKNVTIEGSEQGLAAVGVELVGGETISAPLVVSSADPKTTFLDLVGAGNLEIQFANRISRLRSKGYVAKFHAALSELPTIPGVDSLEGRMIIAPDMDAIEFAYDEAKYGEASESPVMEIAFPSLHDPSVAPQGQHVLSAHVMYAPYDEKTGWSDEARNAFKDRVLATLERHIPGLGALIKGSELLTPLDIEQQYGATGGHWHHVELALEQMMMMRPTHGAAQYATPIPGLYLCGAGSHPGGGIMGAAGHNAARRILK
ncbi:MAG: NAD(P)/FAD-dependent oxidoreductase [Pseudomonadota bacterium]